MDDGPRTGGLQALLLIIGATAAYVTSLGAWLALPFAALAFAGVIWLEIYARRRAREEAAARLRHDEISHLDFDPDPFDRR